MISHTSTALGMMTAVIICAWANHRFVMFTRHDTYLLYKIILVKKPLLSYEKLYIIKMLP